MERSVRILFAGALLLVAITRNVEAQPEPVREIPTVSINFVSIGDLVYFSAGPEMDLWRTDGTTDGTELIKSGFTNRPVNFREFNGMAIFTEGLHTLWISDGTTAGTVKLATSAEQDIRILGVADQYAFFSASNASSGTELYRTDGTPGGTILLRDIAPGTADGFRGAPALVGNTFFFAANNGSDGTELWKSDGTPSGTVMVEDINPGPGDGVSANPFRRNPVFAFQDKLYFVGLSPTAGPEPWISDGTAEGTRILKDIVPGSQGSTISFGSDHDGWLMFSSLVHNDDGSAFNLWKTQGADETTLPIATEAPCECYFEGQFLNYNGELYFTLNRNELTSEVWVTDGSAESTREIFSEFLDGNIPFLEEANGHIVFYTVSQGHPLTLYARYGGSQTMAYNFKSGYTQMAPVSIAETGERIFFADHDGPPVGDTAAPEDYMQAMQTDGESVRSLRDIYGSSFANASNFVNHQEKLLFTTGSGSSPMQLWIYDPIESQEPAGSFTLVNADTDEDIQTIHNDDVISLPENVNINIRFNPVDSPASVKLTISGGTSRIENEAPFALAGDIDGDYNTWAGGESGTYTLYAYPYSEPGGNGEQGTMAEVQFELVRTAPGEDCMASGSILREQWNNIQGNSVSSIPTDTPPNSVSQLDIFEGPANSQTNFGARVSGYICPPATGSYTFWIASNDRSELWLSTDSDPANKVKIAWLERATGSREWDNFSTQRSAAITLTAGKRYYIEALHKQGVGTHNLAVGWQLPGGALERPIPGSRMSPFEGERNEHPVVGITNPADGETFTAPATIVIEANATDDDGSITKVEFFEGSEKLGEDLTAPYSFTWSDVAAGSYTLTATASDDDGAMTTSAPVTIEVQGGPRPPCDVTGTISYERWEGIPGNDVSAIPVSTEPTSAYPLNSFEGPSRSGTNYGARIRGYICPPATGTYTFWIASNDHSELWLSTDSDPANKVRIAYLDRATGQREWDKFASQRSVGVSLTAGTAYYVEVLHKQGIGEDHVAIGWQLPDGTLERPIDGESLDQYRDGSRSTAAARAVAYEQIDVYPNPVQSGAPQLAIAGYDGLEEVVETRIEILRVTGEVVFADKIRCGGACDTYLMNVNKHLVPGVYLINMTTGNTRSSRRLLVK